MSDSKLTQKQQVYVCGTCGNNILNLDSLKHHLVFTHGCNKLTEDRFPTCGCGTTYDNRSNWNHHPCPGKAASMQTMFDRMVKKDSSCYSMQTATVTKRSSYGGKTPTKSPAKSKSPGKKTTPSKMENVTSAKKKKTERSKKKKDKPKKDKKKDKKKKVSSGSEESTVNINSDSSESETLDSSSSEDTTISTSDTDSSSDPQSKKRKGPLIKRPTKKNKPEVSEEHERQWQIMRGYSEPYQLGDPDQTISRQSMTDLTIYEGPGCISFLKTYSQLINPFHGFAKREILRFVKGDSRMFICRDTNTEDSIASAIKLVNERSPRVIKIWEEDKDLKEVVVSSTPYFWVDTIVVPSGNMVGVYTLDNSLQPVPQKDMVCVKCLPFKINISQDFLDLVSKFEDSMVPHYHSSNVDKKSWKGIALKGYTPSHKDLYKPEEMDKTWQREHSISGTQSYEADLQNTDLMIHFKYFLTELEKAIPGKIHRMQILSLAPGGRIKRHSDRPIQSDIDLGKYLMRYHLPLITNDLVKFRVWTLHGEKIEIKMEVGLLYVLDNRKPHEVVNEGDNTRYHLVFDVEFDPALEPVLDRSFQISTPHDDFEEKFQGWKESAEFSNISIEANEEEKAKGEEERIKSEAKRNEEQEKENASKPEDEIMDVEPKISTHHSENLFSSNKNVIADEESSSSSPKKESLSNQSNLSFSISDKFGDVSAESLSDEEDDKDNSNYKLGKRASNINIPPKEKNNKKEKVMAIESKSNQKAVDDKLQIFVTTIDSDNEDEVDMKVDGFVAGDLDEFLQHYELTQFEESFRKNHLSEKVSTFNLISLQDLTDMGFLAADLEKWKKFNPTI
jgi:hypothetical protein